MNGSTKETDSIEYLRQRVFEMENLLNANQMLCNILDPVELYSTIGNLVKEQLKVSTIGILFISMISRISNWFSATDSMIWRLGLMRIKGLSGKKSSKRTISHKRRLRQPNV